MWRGSSLNMTTSNIAFSKKNAARIVNRKASLQMDSRVPRRGRLGSRATGIPGSEVSGTLVVS
jgi:hypothetical protein